MTPRQFKIGRLQLGISQAELGRVLYVTTKHISHVETGYRRPSLALCELLRMKIAADDRAGPTHET